MAKNRTVTFSLNAEKLDSQRILAKLEEVKQLDGGMSRYIKSLILADIEEAPKISQTIQKEPLKKSGFF